MPLKNWGGFSVNRSWIYDSLERIVLAGFADQVLLNTKPLSRVEAARIVAQAVRRVEWDQYGDYNHRDYLEETLYGLVEEFAPELAEMGVRTPLNREALVGSVGFQPVDHAQFGMNFASRPGEIVDSFGQRVRKGANAATTIDGRMHAGDWLSLYYQPEYSVNRGTYQGRFLSDYGKLNFWNTELEVGRDSIWWGPGFRGSMSFSDNAFPLDQVRLSSAEPIHLPWLLSYFGPIKPTLLIAQLDDHRDFPKAKVGAWRLDWAPSRFVELGFNRIFQFGGDGRASINPGQFFKLLFNQGSDSEHTPLNVNNLFSFEGTLRIPDVERYILLARDAAFYFDFGWDDTKFGLFVPDKPGGIFGTYLAGVFGDPKLDLRIEYAKTSDIQFTHSIYTSGFTNRGSVLSHFIGTQGDDLYFRLTRWISPDLLLGLQASRSHIGSPQQPLSLSVTQSQSFGYDVSYRFTANSSVTFGYDFAQLRNQNRSSRSNMGGAKNDHLVQFEFNRSFGR